MLLSLLAALSLIASPAIAAKHCKKGETLCPKANGPKPYCANLQFSNDNCGACAHECDLNHYCYNGVCQKTTYACNPDFYRNCYQNVPCGLGGGCSCVRENNDDGTSGETMCLSAGSGCFGDACHTNADCTDDEGGVCDFSPCCTKILKGQGACFYPSSMCGSKSGSGNAVDPRSIFGMDSR